MIIVKGESKLSEINLTLSFFVHNKYHMETTLWGESMCMWNRVNWADVKIYSHSVSDELMNYKMRLILDSNQLSHDWFLYCQISNVRR
jgi:hypothetical protein